MNKSIMAQLPNQIIMDIIKQSTELKRQPYNSVMVELLSFDAEFNSEIEDEEYCDAWYPLLNENLIEPLYRGGNPCGGGINIDTWDDDVPVGSQQYNKAELLLDRLQ